MHVSNLVFSNTCLYCYEKDVYQGDSDWGSFEGLSKIYHYMPIISLLISLFVFSLVPLAFQPLFIQIILIIMMFITFMASIPYILPSFIKRSEDKQKNYEISISKYNPGIAEFCANHPKKIAIARCPTCFKPYCFKDFTFSRRKEPLECRYCIEKYFNFRLSPLTYYFLTATPLIIVGIVSQALTEGWNNSGMLILLIFLIFLIPLSVFLGVSMVKSIN